MHRKTALYKVWLAIFMLAILSRDIQAEIGFKHIPAWERLIDPMRQPPEMGFSSTLWDSLIADSLEQDTTLSIIFGVDSVLVSADKPTFDTVYVPIIIDDNLLSSDSTDMKSDKSNIIESQTGQSSSSSNEDSGIYDEKKEVESYEDYIEEKIDEAEPLSYHSTIIKKSDYPVEYEASIDTSTNFVIVNSRINGIELPISGAIGTESYLKRSLERSDWESWRKSVLNKFPKDSDRERVAIEIRIPVFRGKWANRVFGGNEVGLSVTGDITINGGLKTENREQLQRDNQSNTNVAFKMDQTQRFHITGSVGEKVKVSIDQDSERLFEFENNLRISYEGNPDEILQSIEAGNVSLTLPRTRLISGSARHQGLFGLKVISQVGPLKLTTIASLDKGEKQTKNIQGGAESQKRTIDPKNFSQNKYFFLDDYYRESYRHINPQNLSHYQVIESQQIVKWEIYKSVQVGESLTSFRGWAHSDPTDPDTSQTDQEHQVGLFVLLNEGVDYSINTQSGYIRINQYLDNKDILAVSYQTFDGAWHGKQFKSEEDLSLKLIRPESPKPPDSTWHLMWRHVYDLGATGIDWDGFSGRIEGKIGEENITKETYPFPEGPLNFIDYRIFGLDYLGSAGEAASPDGRIDQAFLNLPMGELHFPDLRPFDPEGWYFGNNSDSPLIGKKLKDLDSTLFYPQIYDEPISSRRNINTKFDIIVEYENVSASFDLGFLVLEGSEEVILNGRRLSRGADYSIDYNSGTLTILDTEASAAGADLEIKWETGSLVSLDTKTILGMRAEYGLWDDSYIGTTVMYRSQKTQDRRIRVGSEPIKNSIWDINASFVFKPDFLTRAIDWLPLIETNNESKFTIEGEIAQIYPNPNSLNAPSTGDHNGVAYVDDFESIKRSIPLGITRKRWNHASFPLPDTRGEFLWAKKRGRVIWYNPISREAVKDIWPEKEVQATDSKTDVLKVEFQPYWDEWGADNPGNDQFQMSHWGGIMRYLGAGFADQTQSKYIEIWLNHGSVVSGEMYIDLGQITEDVFPNNLLDTEDNSETGYPYGDNILDPGEDTGYDKIIGSDTGESPDSVDINGEGNLLPSYDDYEDRNDAKINGTEGNRNINNYPDTEDLDGDKYLDQTDNFFRYKIDFSEGDNSNYIAGGLSNVKGWRLYRIPLADTMSIGDASLNAIEYARIWFTGFRHSGSIKIAQIDIVGNEWLEDEVGPTGKKVEPIRVAVINTHDNPPPEYNPPPGVSGELDPVTNQRAKEQSLVLKIDKLGTGEIGSISKRIQKSIDLLDYKFLKMFVHGGNYTEQLTDRMGRELNLDMFFRFGTDIDENYYEYSQKLFSGWSPNNEIVIDMERLSSIKFLREQDSLRDYDILPNGDVIRVVGNPSLGSLRYLVIGVKNHGRSITSADKIEIWVDELRVSDVHRNPGWAARGSMALNLADLINVSASMDQKDANFHGVDKRQSPVGSSQSLTGNLDMKFHFDKFFNPQWGLRIPLSGHYNQKINIPKFKPNSDILLAALGGEQVNAFSIFSESLTSNNRFSDNPVYTSPSDSLISLNKRYSFNTSFSKAKKSDKILVHYTLDQFSLDGLEHSESYISDERLLYKKEVRNKGSINYKFPIDDPIKLSWLRWAENVPILKRYFETEFQALPRSLSVNARAEETDKVTKKRTGTIDSLYTFKISRSYNLSWQPLTILGANLGQTFAGEHHRDEFRRSTIARNQVAIDSTEYFIINPEDSSAAFDSTAYANAVEKEMLQVRKDIYWKLGGMHFIDRSLSQNFSTNLRPDLLSWLSTDANYSARYSWGWSESFGPGDRSINTNSNLSTSLTLRLQSLMRGWDERSNRKKLNMDNLGAPDNDINNDAPYPDNPFDAFEPIDKPMPGIDKPIVEEEDSRDVEGDLEMAEQDSVIVKKPRAHPLAPIKFLLRRLKDIRYQYNLSNNPRNNSVEPGQANWMYRLGFTKDPGLDRIEGYVIHDSNNRQDRHTLSSGFDLTQNLRLTNLSYNITKSENSTFNQGKSGSNSSTMWHYFPAGESELKSFPILNYSASWSGLSDFEFVKKFANSVSVQNAFNGSSSETWQFYRIDSVKTINSVSYDKSFSPLLGMSFGWKMGISSSMSYNFTQRVTDNRSMNSKTRSVNESMSFQSNYTSRKGFRIPIPIWPFKNRRFKNSTSFALSYQFSKEYTETSTNNEEFSEPNKSTSWSVSPSIDYSFSTTVKGGFDYEYGVRNTQLLGKVSSQEFSFRVNISIRG